MEILVECTRAMHVEKLLRDRDIAFEVLGYDNVPTMLPVVRNKHRIPRPMPSTSVTGQSWKPVTGEKILDWENYFTAETIYKWMSELERLYPAMVTVSDIGKSVEGRPIKMLKVSNSDARNSGVWLDGCIHAREWISVCAVTYVADYVVRNFSKLPVHFTNKDWFFVPIINPDGYHHTHTNDRMWRKSRARFGNTIVGVDLNRNFGHNWGLTGFDVRESTSVGDPNHNNYRGLGAFSEPESCAVKDLILYSGIPFKIFLTFHACSEVIAFPWCFTSDPCPDYVNLLEGGATMVKAIFDTTGRLFKLGNFKDIMYFASGTSIDWSYGTAKIPFSYLVELRSKEHRFLLPKDEILDACKEAFAAVKALVEFVDKKKCLNCTVYNQKWKM